MRRTAPWVIAVFVVAWCVRSGNTAKSSGPVVAGSGSAGGGATESYPLLEGLKPGDNIVAGTYQAIRELKDGALVRTVKPEEKKASATEKKT